MTGPDRMQTREIEIKAKDLQPELRQGLDVTDDTAIKVRLEVVDEAVVVGRRAIDILGDKVDRVNPKGVDVDIEAIVREGRAGRNFPSND